MTEADYAKILDHLQNASRIFAANQGDLCDTDLRVRSWVNHAATEVERTLASARRGGAQAPAWKPELKNILQRTIAVSAPSLRELRSREAASETARD
jgi:hypothetical protein